ncbi:unnamed protein product [Linum trigynum]|uniref:Uncharacterized protein n=1 Tax=Linum trigynum TaxID=586398 RepID=A0AAV2CGI8_9ROSI
MASVERRGSRWPRRRRRSKGRDGVNGMAVSKSGRSATAEHDGKMIWSSPSPLASLDDDTKTTETSVENKRRLQEETTEEDSDDDGRWRQSCVFEREMGV